MSEFIEAADNVFIRKECIEALVGNQDGTSTIHTEGNKFIVNADALLIMDILDKELAREKEIEKLTSQYFGG